MATITAQLILRNVVSNSFVTPEYVKTWRLAKLNYPLRNSNIVRLYCFNCLGKNLTFGAPIEIYRRRRRVEFIGGGGVPAAAPTSETGNQIVQVLNIYFCLLLNIASEEHSSWLLNTPSAEQLVERKV